MEHVVGIIIIFFLFIMSYIFFVLNKKRTCLSPLVANYNTNSCDCPNNTIWDEKIWKCLNFNENHI